MDLLSVKKDLEKYMLNYLEQMVKERNYNYETFGKEIEPLMAKGVKKFFIENQSVSDSEFSTAKNKNDFPDLKFNDIAIEFKCGRYDKDPENDMGTLNSWPKKIESYGDNIYYLFVAYDESEEKVEIRGVFFDKFYKFIGKNSNGVLKYREKDGNLRPKRWEDFFSERSYFNSLIEFNDAIDETVRYRSARIVNKHVCNMNESDLKDLYNRVGEKINLFSTE